LPYPLLHNGPVHYFARLAGEQRITLEGFDSYIKQSYRNRCRILGANGVMSLSIPVVRKKGEKTLYRDVGIDYTQPWAQVHWKSIVSAYAVSPFFEYVQDELEPFYKKRFTFLMDLNMKLLEKTLYLLNLDISMECSEDFAELSGPKDHRSYLPMKKGAMEADPDFRILPYHQVFMDRHGFQPNLSILDLLFNMGPESSGILRQSLKASDQQSS